MKPLENLIVAGISYDPETNLKQLKQDDNFYSMNIWNSAEPSKPISISIPYRGGYTGGFNDILAHKDTLYLADGEGILCFDPKDLSKSYVELKGVNEVSDLLCKTSDYLISCLHNIIQIRSIEEISGAVQESETSSRFFDVPFKQFQYGNEGDTILSMPMFGPQGNEKVLLNNTSDESYIFDLTSNRFDPLKILTAQTFDSSFQRRHKYHFLPTDNLKYSIFTESTNDKLVPNRVYELSTRNSPELREVDPLVMENKKILSMLPTKENKLQFLTNYKRKSFIEMLDPYSREIVDSRPLSGRYELGDRLQEVGNQLLIVRHLRNEIVDAETEGSIKLEGAENNVAIPEISSSWEYPQYLYLESAKPT